MLEFTDLRLLDEQVVGGEHPDAQPGDDDSEDGGDCEEARTTFEYMTPCTQGMVWGADLLQRVRSRKVLTTLSSVMCFLLSLKPWASEPITSLWSSISDLWEPWLLFHDSMVPCLHGCMVAWLHGCMVPWFMVAANLRTAENLLTSSRLRSSGKSWRMWKARM